MRAALGARAAAAPLPARSSLVGPAFRESAVLLAAAVLAGGGAEDGPLLWIGGGAVLATAAAIVAALLGAIPTPDLGQRAGRQEACSVRTSSGAASASAGRSAPTARGMRNRGCLYTAMLAAGVVVSSLSRRSTTLAAAVAAVFGVAVLWALAGKVVPPIRPRRRPQRPPALSDRLLERSRSSSRCRFPSGCGRHPCAVIQSPFAQGAVLLFTSIVAPPDELPRRRRRRARRRGRMARARAPLLESAIALLLAGPLGLVVSAWALEQPGLVEAGASSSQRWTDGLQLGVALVAGGAVVAAGALVLMRREEGLERSDRARIGRLALAVAAALTFVVLVAGIARVDNPVSWVDARVDEFRNPPSVR